MEKKYRNQLYNINKDPGITSSQSIEAEQLKLPACFTEKSLEYAFFGYSFPIETEHFNEKNVISFNTEKSLISDEFDLNKKDLQPKESKNNFKISSQLYNNSLVHKEFSNKFTRPERSEIFNNYSTDLFYSASNPALLKKMNILINYPTSSLAQNSKNFQKCNLATMNEARRNSFTCSSSSSSPSSPSPSKQPNLNNLSDCHDQQFFQFYSKEALGLSENEVPKINDDEQISNNNQFYQSQSLRNGSEIQPTLLNNNKRPKSNFPFGKCKVCNDKATGVHYGIATCEGCKGFFKRSTLRKEKYRCFFGSNCPLTPDNRNRCKSCRFRKCIEVGMSIQGVKMGRIPKAEKEKALLGLKNTEGTMIFINDGGEEDEQTFDESEENTHSCPYPCESECSSYDQKKTSDDGNKSNNSSDYEEAGETNSFTEEKRCKKLRSDISYGSIPDKRFDTSSENSNFGKIVQNANTVANSELINENLPNTSNFFQEKTLNQLENQNTESRNISSSSNRPNCVYFKKSLAVAKSEAKMDNLNNSHSYLYEYDKISLLKNQKVNEVLNNELKKENNSDFSKNNPFDLQSLLRIYDVPLKSFNFSVNRKLLNTTLKEDELNQTYHLILSVLSDKIYQLYIDDIQSLTKQRERALKLIFHGVKKFEGHSATKTEIWDGLLESIPQIIRSLTLFARQIPGLNEIGQKDFYTIINSNVFNYYILRNSQLFIYGESYMLLPNNIQYTRDWMLRIIGKEMTDTLFRFCEEFNMLGLRGKEIALLYPFVLTSLIEDEKLEDSTTLQSLNEFYYKALLYEFDLNNRDLAFYKKFHTTMTKLSELNQLQKREIISLKPKREFESCHRIQKTDFNFFTDLAQN